jgi:acetyl-CoA carboxylase carboxyltransferase component
VKTYEEKFANPYKAASLGYVDEVIFPEKHDKELLSI